MTLVTALKPVLRELLGSKMPKQRKSQPRLKVGRRRNGAPKRRAVGRVRMRTATIPASVNTASSIRASQTRNLRLESNTDRLFHITVPSGAPRGTIIYDQIITPAIAARLQTQASLFQKIHYKSLRFEVQTQTPTTNSGGYVVAFLHDPQMEVGTGEAALRALTAIQGTKTSKFWQSTDMAVKTTQQEYYTLQGNDVRLFSPGRFIVLTDGPPSSDVSITILFHWTVGLSRPALQRLVNRLPQGVVTASALYSTTEGLRYTNWNPNTNAFNPTIDPVVPESLNMETAIYGIPPLSSIGNNVLWYYLERTVTVQEGATNPRVRNVNFVSLRAVANQLVARVHTFPSDEHTIYAEGAPAGDPDFVMWQGMRMTPITPGEFTGNEDVAFLVNVLPSVSVNRQPMILKEFLEIKPTLSIKQPELKGNLLEKLSKMQLQEW